LSAGHSFQHKVKQKMKAEIKPAKGSGLAAGGPGF
jgi:hypothetical protein